MTMATNGKQIESLSKEEQEREYRLRYAGAVEVLSLNELRVAAARLVATYPKYTLQQFMQEAERAFCEVQGGVVLSARDVRHFDATELAGKPDGK